MGWGGAGGRMDDQMIPIQGEVTLRLAVAEVTSQIMIWDRGQGTAQGRQQVPAPAIIRPRGAVGERSEDGRGFARRSASPSSPWMAGFYKNFKVGKGECVGHGFQVSYVNGARPQRPRNVRRKLQAP